MKEQGTKELDRLTQAIAKDPDNLELILAKGRLLLAMGNFSEAAELFRYLFAENPDNPDFLSGYIEALILTDNADEAHRLCDHLLSISPGVENEAFFTLLSELHNEHGKSREAIYLLDKAIEANYVPEGMYLLKAIVLFDIGQTEQANYYLNLCIEFFYADPIVLYYAAISLGLSHPSISLRLYLAVDKYMSDAQKKEYLLPLNVLIADFAYDTENYKLYLKHLRIACKKNPKSVYKAFSDRMGDMTPDEFYDHEKRELENK